MPVRWLDEGGDYSVLETAPGITRKLEKRFDTVTNTKVNSEEIVPNTNPPRWQAVKVLIT